MLNVDFREYFGVELTRIQLRSSYRILTIMPLCDFVEGTVENKQYYEGPKRIGLISILEQYVSLEKSLSPYFDTCFSAILKGSFHG